MLLQSILLCQYEISGRVAAKLFDFSILAEMVLILPMKNYWN